MDLRLTRGAPTPADSGSLSPCEGDTGDGEVAWAMECGGAECWVEL